MKILLSLALLSSFQLMANETLKKDVHWEKTKKVINETAVKIDKGTRSVIKKAKSKIKEEQQEREAREARKRN